MTREDLFEAIGMADEACLARCYGHWKPAADAPMEDTKMRTYSASSEYTGRRKRSKIWLLAAVIGVLALLVGSLTVIHYMIANAFTKDTAQTDISQLTQEHFRLSVDDVTPLSMRITCSIDREVVKMDYIPVQTAAPYTIEKQTDDGWEPLEPKTNKWSKDRNVVMVWDEFAWTVEWFDVYSVLEQGNYRFTTTLIDELGPMSVEFTVGSQFTTENVHLSVGDVTPTSMRVYMTVDRDVYTLGDVWVHWEGPYTIEKKTETGWEPLPLKAETWKQTTTQTAVWDEFDWPVDWSASYGVLESGTYRFTTELAEDIGPMSVEFEIAETDNATLADVVESLMNEEAYYICHTYSIDYGPQEQYTQKQWEEIIEFMENGEQHRLEYWKSGDDLLYLSYHGDRISAGMMYKDGIRYRLDHEDGDSTKAVIGWNQKPAVDISRLTDWSSDLLQPGISIEVEYGEDGKVKRFVGVREGVGIRGAKDACYVETTVWDVVSTDPAVAAAKLAEQDVNVSQPFSWEEDAANMPARDVEFLNTTVQPVSTVSEVIALAQNECTVDYTKIIVYRDEEAGMWKVEFQMEYGYHGYQYIYLDDEGITQMVSGAGSKVASWQYKYPGP